jgi:hypothetical protein
MPTNEFWSLAGFALCLLAGGCVVYLGFLIGKDL